MLSRATCYVVPYSVGDKEIPSSACNFDGRDPMSANVFCKRSDSISGALRAVQPPGGRSYSAGCEGVTEATYSIHVGGVAELPQTLAHKSGLRGRCGSGPTLAGPASNHRPIPLSLRPLLAREAPSRSHKNPLIGWAPQDGGKAK